MQMLRTTLLASLPVTLGVALGAQTSTPALQEDESAAPARPRVVVRGVEIGWVETYGEAPEGDVVALVDSFGLVEVARVGGSAEDALRISLGDIVSLELP